METARVYLITSIIGAGINRVAGRKLHSPFHYTSVDFRKKEALDLICGIRSLITPPSTSGVF